MTTSSRVPVLSSVATAAALLAGAALAGPAAAAGPGPVPGRLLPVPSVPAGTFLSVTAVDVNPLGVVGGTAELLSTTPDGGQTGASTPQRWAAVPRLGWRRQQLAMPAGATFGSVAGLTNLGEAAGTYTAGGASHAVRWSITGRSATRIGGPGSTTTAVGPNGPWGVSTPAPENPIAGGAELVARDGARTPLRGTPELDAGYRRTAVSIGGPDTALVGVTSGAGYGGRFTPVLWRAGATLGLPVFNSPLGVTYCASPVQADGSLVYSGIVVTPETGPERVLVRHVGGVPGRDVELARSGPGDPRPVGTLGCEGSTTVDVLAADGGIAGAYTGPEGAGATYWDAANVRTVVPRAADEADAYGAAVATGRRMVIRSQGPENEARLAFWHDGVRTPLAVPGGWRVARVVELTDRGLLVANLVNDIGQYRPAAWDLSRR